LAAAVILVFGRGATNAFINFDDDTYITENPAVLAGLRPAGVVWALTTTTESNWHPLTWLSLMVDADLARAVGGPGALSAVVHLHNAALHALCAVLVLLALRRMGGRTAPALLAASLFALHPLRVESVTWAAERKDVLSAVFFAAALLAYARTPRGRGLPLVTLLMALGLLAKPMLVTLPCVLLLLDAWPLRRAASSSWRSLIVEKTPLFALSLASSGITWWVQSRGGAASSLDSVPLVARIINAVLAYGVYLRKTLWPMDLAVFYPHAALVREGLSPARTVGAAAVGLGLGVATWAILRARTTRPHLAVGWLWYLGTLVPVLGIVQVGRQGWADRYTYLPSIGLAIAAAWAVAEAAARRPAWAPRLVAGCAVVLGLLSVLTWIQIGRWRDGETLYRSALRVTRENFLVHNNLGVTLADAGRPAEAALQYEAALRANPAYAEAHNNLGVVLKRQGRLDEAERHFLATLRLRPDFEAAHNNLGNLYMARGEFDRARERYEAALRIAPTYAEALANFGILLAETGDLDRAEARLLAAVASDPGRSETRKNLGIVLLRQGRVDAAAEEYERAVVLDPSDARLRSDLGILRMRQGRLDAAEGELRRALALRPGFPPAQAAMRDLEALRRGQSPPPERPQRSPSGGE
jgi:Tfp pilus assembly protein PilF